MRVKLHDLIIYDKLFEMAQTTIRYEDYGQVRHRLRESARISRVHRVM